MAGESDQWHEQGPFLIDASVIIDYQRAQGLRVHKVLGSEIGTAAISSLTPGHDARDFSLDDCRNLGLKIIEVTSAHILAAGELSHLGVYDACNLILAQENRCTLLTNDRRLWQAAQARKVPYMRGLAIMVLLVKRSRLEPSDACGIARRVVSINGYLTPAIFDDFCSQIKSYCRSCPEGRHGLTATGGRRSTRKRIF